MRPNRRSAYGGAGWSGGSYLDYDREYCVDLVQLARIPARNPAGSRRSAGARRGRADAAPGSSRGCKARDFEARCTIDVLRHGIKHGAHDLNLFYGAPSPGNERRRRERFEQNRFTVTRQLRYSRDESQRALDIALFINGLPVFTFELKNNLTKQTVDDGVWQYRRGPQPRARSCSNWAVAWPI